MSLLFGYRACLLILLGVAALGIVSPGVLSIELPKDVQTWVDQSGGAEGPVLISAMLIAVLAYLAGCLSALWFWRPSRYLFAAGVVTAMLLNPLLGVSIDSGWKDLVEEAATVLDGVLIALMFCSPLSAKFTSLNDLAQS